MSHFSTLTGQMPGVSATVALPIFLDLAQQLDLETTVEGNATRIFLASGAITLEAKGAGLGLSLRAEDPRRLYMLQQLVHVRLDRLGPEARVNWERVDEGKLPPSLMLAEVISVQQISPNFRRVRIKGEDLTRFEQGGLHFRMVVAKPGRAPVWPRIDADGRTRWPEGEDALHRPVYTIRAVNAAEGWLDIDVFQHEGGRITEWTLAATAGTPLGIMGPTGRELTPAPWVALFADETALPALARLIADMPATTQGHAFVSLGDLADRQEITPPPGLTLHWMKRGEDATLIATLEALEIPATDRFVWFAAESAEAIAARRLLREDRGFLKTEMSVTGYWSQPEPNPAP